MALHLRHWWFINALLVLVLLAVIALDWSTWQANIQLDDNRFESLLALTANPPCSDLRNQLFVIDDQWALHSKAGSCADAAYQYTLYDLRDGMEVCRSFDSIAGPQTRCTVEAITNDDDIEDLFAQLLLHVAEPNLGLSSARVQQLR